MNAPALLSPKLALVSADGFALRHSRQAHYEFDWHQHDCAMLLWPRLGGLQSAWQAEGETPKRCRLARTSALLLPPGTAHRTLSDTQRQEHGELYLAPELVGRRFLDSPGGAIRLDSAAVSLLDALLAPALDPRALPALIDALVTQMAGALPLAASAPPPTIARRLLQRFTDALDGEQSLPSVDVVAMELGVSIRQLQRSCRQELGESPVTLRRLLQARHARRWMDGGLSLAQVSTRMGFATSGHLSRLLRGVPD